MIFCLTKVVVMGWNQGIVSIDWSASYYITMDVMKGVQLAIFIVTIEILKMLKENVAVLLPSHFSYYTINIRVGLVVAVLSCSFLRNTSNIVFSNSQTPSNFSYLSFRFFHIVIHATSTEKGRHYSAGFSESDCGQNPQKYLTNQEASQAKKRLGFGYWFRPL